MTLLPLLSPLLSLYGVFFLFLLSSLLPPVQALFVVSPGLNGGNMLRINHADFAECGVSPPIVTYFPLVSINGDLACNTWNNSVINISGAAILFQQTFNCDTDTFIPNVMAAGAKMLVGAKTDSTLTQTPGWPLQLASNAGTNYPIICKGITVYDYHMLAAAAVNSSIQVMTYQKPIQPNQTIALNKLLPLLIPTANREDWTRWNPDMCTTVLKTYPGRPDSWGCDEDGMVNVIGLPPQIQGVLPEELSLLTSLWFLVIAPSYGLTGNLSLSFANWTRLEVIHFENTFLNYIPPDLFASWPILKDCYFRNADLVSPLPTVIATTVRNLIFDENRLSGTIPPTLVQHPNIFEIDFDNNGGLYGTIPDLDMLSQLKWLELSGNQFTGIGKLPPTLLLLDISNNGLTELPDISHLTGVQNLVFAFNKLTQMPNLTGLTQLTEIRAEFNQISGYLNPTAVFPNVPGLTSLHLSGNQISTIDLEGFAPFPQLLEIHLDFNNLTSFPDFYFVPNLQYLDVSYNQIHAGLKADVFYNFPGGNKLLHFGARSNRIYDSPETAFDTFQINFMTQMTDLDLSYNNISLYLPNIVTLPSVITRLYLNNNSWIGTVPEDWVNLERLDDVRLDQNLLHNDGLLLPSFMDYSFDSYTTYTTEGIQCPTIGFKRDPLATVTLDPSYYDYQLCRCVQNYYYLPSSVPGARPQCYPCLDYAVCPGEEKPFLYADQNINIVARQGYFPIPNRTYPTQILPCQYGVLRPDDPENPCNPGIALNFVSNNVRDLNTSFACRNGSSDRLCSRCDHGYYAKNGKCFTCDAQASYPVFFIIFILVLFFFAAYFAVPSLVEQYDQNAPLVYEIGPVLLDFFQTTSIITSRLDNPSVTHALQSALGVAAMSTSQSGLGLECLTGFPDFVTQYYWTVGAPGLWIALMYFFFVCKFAIFWCLGKYIGWKKEGELVVRGTLMILNFVYFPIVTAILTVFSCDPDPATGIRYLRDRPYLQCNAISPQAKAVPLVIYLVGIYFLFAGLSYRLGASKKRRMDDFYVTIFGFFYLPFYGGKIWAGVVFMLVKLCISIVVAVVSFKADYYALLVVWILNCKLIFVIYQKPYSVAALNTFEILATIFAVFVFLNSIVFSSSQLFDNNSVMPALTWFLIVLGLIVFMFYLISQDHHTRNLVKKALSKTGLTTRNLEREGSIGSETPRGHHGPGDEEEGEGHKMKRGHSNGLTVETHGETSEPEAPTPSGIPATPSTAHTTKKGSQSNLHVSHSTELLLTMHPDHGQGGHHTHTSSQAFLPDHHHTSSLNAQAFLATPSSGSKKFLIEKSAKSESKSRLEGIETGDVGIESPSKAYLPTPSGGSKKFLIEKSPKSESKSRIEGIETGDVGIELQALSSPSKVSVASPSTPAGEVYEEDDSDSSDEEGYTAGQGQADRPRRHSRRDSEGRKLKREGGTKTRKK